MVFWKKQQPIPAPSYLSLNGSMLKIDNNVKYQGLKSHLISPGLIMEMIYITYKAQT